MRPLAGFLLYALVLAGPVAAQGLLYRPILDINPISDTRFEVIESRGGGPSEFWCAAGYYAHKVLGAQRGRVYILTPRGPSVTEPGRTGVVFTLEPPENPVSSYTLTLNQVGKGLLIGVAINHCRDRILEPRDY